MTSKVIWKFFGAFALLTLIGLLVLNFFVSLRLQSDSERKITSKLQSNAILVGDVIREDLAGGNTERIAGRTAELARRLDLRITIIDTAGRVLADSDKDPSLLDNHGDRPEVIEAVDTGFGQSTRPSDTLGYAMKYVAVRLDHDGSTLAVVRFALPLSEVQLEIRHIYRVVFAGAIAAALISLTVAYFLSRSITSPIRNMQQVAHRIAKGDFSSRVRIRSSDELGELARSLNKMADELQQKIENLKRMDRVRTDFVANVSHELKTPLTLIKGYIETLEGRALDDRQAARKFITIMKEHANRLENIIDDLLSLSELELSSDVLHKTQWDIKGLVEEVIMGFEHAVTEKKQSLTTSFEGDDFTIDADRDKVERVLFNLVDNAVKYTPAGGTIDVSVVADAERVALKVSDNGIGIPPEHLDRVFERFYRVDKARSRRLGGTGLGLGIAKHVVQAHRGEITIESRPRAGTAVSVVLPRR